MEDKSKNNTVALFIDGENISQQYIQKILEKTEQYGNVIIKRIYADWSNSNSLSWKKLIQNHSLAPIQHFPIGVKKNSIDIRMSIDIMDIFHTRAIDIFVVVSSDGDYTPLVQYLKEGGKTVIGMGESKATQIYQKSFSIPFICLNLDQMKETDIPTQENINNKKQKISEELVEQVITIARNRLNNTEDIPLQKLAIQAEIPDFDPKKYLECKTLFSFMEKVIKNGEVKDFELYWTDKGHPRLRKIQNFTETYS